MMKNSLSLFIISLLLLNTTSVTIDELALITFKNTITSDPYGFLTTNWSTESSLCTWIGVTCDANRERVVALNVSNFTLGGTVSPHIGNLTFLQSLDMSFNNFNGTLPSELSNLRHLEEINVGDNNLGGEIPWLGALSQLRRLRLANNAFSGVIPPSLFNISRLQSLQMGGNLFHGEIHISEEAGNLSSLEVLRLSYNQLTGPIPETIFKISSLVELMLGYNNKLVNTLPDDICNNARRLKVVWLDGNQLSGQIPANICSCTELKTLSIYQNNFSGRITSEIGCLSMLERLILGNNQLTGYIPKQIGNLTSLSYVDLSGNKLEGELPVEVGALQFLEFLSVQNNVLSGNIPSSIFNISTLQNLSLSYNDFEGLLPSHIGGSLSNLKELYMTANRFSGPIPSSIANASNLQKLDLSDNFYSGSMPDFSGFTNLTTLYVWGNNLTGEGEQPLQFLSSLTNCRYLDAFDVSMNPLNGLLPTSIGNFSASLLNFYATESNIHGVIPSEIGNLSSLLNLQLYENQLTGFIPSSLGKLNRLQRMDLGNNRLLGYIPHLLCNLTNLGDIYLNDNMLEGPIPDCLGGVGSLKNINFGSNYLNSSIPSNFWNLADLVSLSLSSNHLSGHISSQIENLRAITSLDLSSNKFSGDIPTSVSSCQTLEDLSLSNNLLTGLIPQSLSSVSCLKSLDLSINNLSGFIPKSFEKLRFLEYFNVSYNALSGLIPDEGPFANFTAQSFVNNSHLCGSPRFHVPHCKKNDGRSRSKYVARLMAYAVPSFISAVVLAMIVFTVILRRRSKPAPPKPDIPPDVYWKTITYRELVQGTDGFSDENLLGRGGFSSVYKGTLSDKSNIAVKVFNLKLEKGAKSFDTECRTLCSIRHRNLVRIVGSCTNADFRALILEYMPNGSLERLLYDEHRCLNLLDLLQIAIDVALALEYLHHGHHFPVVHCDIKPSNVLLDKDMTARVADFGISKMFEEEETLAQTRTLATIGYAAPEYGSEGAVSTKADVYSFGIMLLEMFTRKKPTDDMFTEEMSLKQWVSEAVERDAVIEVVDLISAEDKKCVSSVFGLAMKCSEMSPRNRISMTEAVDTLKKIKSQVADTKKIKIN